MVSLSKFLIALNSKSNLVALKEIGSIVEIEPGKIKDRLPKSLYENILANPYGEIVEYKMTDGKGVGLIIMLKNGEKIWVFNNELREDYDILSKDIEQNFIFNLAKEYYEFQIIKFEEDLHKNKASKLSHILNPINFIRWVMFTTKDVF